MTNGFDRRFIPPLSALIALEAAARHGSFTRAAEELNLTQGAVSRQIKLLEDRLGLALFLRAGQRVILTEAGSFYTGRLRAGLAELAAATAETIAFNGRGGTLNLAILPTLGTRWLIPRLPAFFRRHRDVGINFSTRVRPFDFAGSGLDAALHFGDPVWPGAVLHRLMDEALIPVAAPVLLAEFPVSAPADLVAAPRLVQATRPQSWRHWFAAKGCGLAEEEEARPALHFEQFALVLRAAVAGLGFAIVPTVLVREELAAGELVPLFGPPVGTVQGYYLAYPAEKAVLPALVAFRAWLLEEVADNLPQALMESIKPLETFRD